MAAWRRTLNRAVASGRLKPNKAKLQRNNLSAAQSWHYGIGLVSVVSGRFTNKKLNRPLGGVNKTQTPK